MGSLLIGFSLGFFVAAQIGPISLLVMRTVLGGALTAGLAIGAGAAVIDALYAALGQAGAAAVLQIDAIRLAFGVIGAVVLIGLGLPDVVVGVPGAVRHGVVFGGGDAAAGILDVAGGDCVEPVDDRVVGGDLRSRDDGRRGGVGRRDGADVDGCRPRDGDVVQRAVSGALAGAAAGRAAGVARRRRDRRLQAWWRSAGCWPCRPLGDDGAAASRYAAAPARLEPCAQLAPVAPPTIPSLSTISAFQGWIDRRAEDPCVGGARRGSPGSRRRGRRCRARRSA